MEMRGLRAYLGELEATLGDDDMLGYRHGGHHRDHGRHHGSGHPDHGGHPGHAGKHQQLVRVSPHAAAAIEELDKGPGDPEGLIEPLGFTPVVFVAGGPTTLQAQAHPQRRFKGSRLFCDPARTGASAAGQLLLIASIKWGGREMLPSSDPALLNAFAPTSFGASLSSPIAGQGTIVTVTYSIVGAALAGADTIAIGTQWNGLTVGTSE